MELSINLFRLAEKYGALRASHMGKVAGFSACDYSLALIDKSDSPLYGENYVSVAEGIRKDIENGGLKITQTHAPFGFSQNQWDTPHLFTDTVLPTLVKSIEITAIMGAPIVVVHPIHHMEYRGHEEEIFKKNMGFYRTLIPYAKEYGVKIAVENMWQKDKLRNMNSFDTCGTSSEFIRYVDTLDSEHIVACLDVGHVELPDGSETVQDIIYALGHDRLKALHIHDNDYKGDQHLLPYFGKLNWAEITKALGEIDYNGDFTYEVNNYMFINVCDALAQDAVNYMGTVGKELVRQVEANRRKICI